MNLEYLLLGLLALKPQTGYDLKKFLDTFGRFMRSNTELSQIYRTMGKMVKDGWVEFEVTHREGLPDFKTYRLTEDGAAVFLDWLSGTYVPPSRFTDPEFSLRFHYSALVGRDATLKLLHTELDARIEQVQKYRGRDRTLRDLELPLGGDPLAVQRRFDLGHEWGRQQVDAWIDWLKATIAEIEKEPQTAAPALRIVGGRDTAP
ncbi:MAG TPA: PadR family transcriptional regulator [Rhizobiaceae bacterium]|nr:PadR family transcriptional regulator [Rhizobiaceae bacterium]